ncbi:hypothetical protein [Chromohalobacter israelensis]
MDTFKGKTTAAEMARQYDLTLSEVDGWIDGPQRSGRTGSRPASSTSVSSTNPSSGDQRALGKAHLQTYVLKKFKRRLK